MTFQLIFPACLILAATTTASVTMAPPDGLTSKAKNVTSAVSVFPASNTTIAPNGTWNSPTSTKNTPSVAATTDKNSTESSSELSTSTLQPENTTTTTSANTQLTTALQPSPNATAGPAGTVSVSTQDTLPTANTDKTSNTPSHGYQTTEAYRNISTWTSSSAHLITQGSPSEMSYSEKSMTIFFSVLLGIIVLIILMYIIQRCKGKTQYSHHPLYNSSQETGGLYDGPCIYNPTITTLNEEEEFHNDQPPFARPTQLRLEFLNEDQENKSLDYETSKFETFQPVEKDS